MCMLDMYQCPFIFGRSKFKLADLLGKKDKVTVAYKREINEYHLLGNDSENQRFVMRKFVAMMYR